MTQKTLRVRTTIPSAPPCALHDTENRRPARQQHQPAAPPGRAPQRLHHIVHGLRARKVDQGCVTKQARRIAREQLRAARIDGGREIAARLREERQQLRAGLWLREAPRHELCEQARARHGVAPEAFRVLSVGASATV